MALTEQKLEAIQEDIKDERSKKERIDDQMDALKTVGKTVVENIPGVGEAILAKDIAGDVSEGNYASAALGTAALGMGFLPGGDILNKPVRAFAKKFRKVDEAEANKFLDNPDELQAWRDDPINKVDKAEKKRRETRKYPEQAKELESGLMSGPEYRKYIRENQPATKFTLEDLQTMVPTFKDTVGALGKSKASKGIVGLNKKIEKGTIVDSRLDIPAYNEYNTWVASMTLPNKGGNVYGRTAVLKDVDFSISTSPEKVRKIAKDETKKFPMATMKGEWQDLSDEEAFQLAQKYLADPKSGYVQVGFNPERHSFFYDKDTMMPIFEAEEVVQIGALVLAKPKLPKTAAERAARIGKLRELKIENPDRVGRPATFNEGGMAIEKQMEMFEDGGLMDEGGTVDPVSGNDVPPGSTQEEVRDDIPAQLSEGEFVFPADVVRYIGLENLMSMRQDAKQGLAQMEAMGQMGNSEEATIPDDLPFDIYDLDIEDDEPLEMQVGGSVPGVYTQPSYLSQYGQQVSQVTPSVVSVPSAQQFRPPTYTPPEYKGPTFEDIIPSPTGSYDELRTFVNDEGLIRQIPFIDGKPIYPIPEGFYPQEKAKETIQTPTTVGRTQVTGGDRDEPEAIGTFTTRNEKGEQTTFGVTGGKGTDIASLTDPTTGVSIGLDQETVDNLDKLGIDIEGIRNKTVGVDTTLTPEQTQALKPAIERLEFQRAIKEVEESKEFDEISRMIDPRSMVERARDALTDAVTGSVRSREYAKGKREIAAGIAMRERSREKREQLTKDVLSRLREAEELGPRPKDDLARLKDFSTSGPRGDNASSSGKGTGVGDRGFGGTDSAGKSPGDSGFAGPDDGYGGGSGGGLNKGGDVTKQMKKSGLSSKK